MPWTLSAFADEAGQSTDAQIAACRRGNLRFIDLRGVDGHNISVLPLDLAQAVAKKLAAADITVQMLGSPIGKIDATDDVGIDVKKLEHLGELAKVFHCNAVRMFSYYNKTKLPKPQWRQRTLDNLRRLIDVAGRHGLVLYHENESEIFGDHSDDMLALAPLRDGTTFKFIYDFANYIRTGEDGWTTWQKMKGTTDAFHFKDQRKDGQHMPMGDGETDALRIVQDAATGGWSGPVTIEPHLTHSAAVLATHVSGSGAKALKDLPPADTFQIAAEASHALLRKCGVTYR